MGHATPSTAAFHSQKPRIHLSAAAQEKPDTLRAGLLTPLVSMVADWGAGVLNSIRAVGDFTLFTWRTLKWITTALPYRETMVVNFHAVGVLSLPVVALVGTFIGMVLAVQSYYQFRSMGLETQLGAVINMSLVRELGPVLAATMLAGRVGSAMAAQLGTMRVTEQIDALSSMGVNPYHYLVVPRFLACVMMIPPLAVMGVFMGVVGGFSYSVFLLGIDTHHYWYNSEQFVGVWDFFTGIFKSLFFGAAIGQIACYQGFHCRPGAEGVGAAATASFVYSFIVIIVLDLFLNIVLDSVYFMIWPTAAKLGGV